MTTDRIFLAFAGLLHDVGKFRQRAHWGDRLPHEEHGARWVAEVLAPRLSFLDSSEQHRLREAIRQHHEHPYDRDARAVIVADRLAAGERVDREEEERGAPAEEPLLTVFSSIHLEGRPATTSRYAYHTVPLPVRGEDWEKIFPVPAEKAHVDYPALWASFEQAVEHVPQGVWATPEHALHALLALLRAHAWCIPAATWRNEPDVSLYDHLRMTAALAVCVGEQDEATIARWEEQTARREFPREPVALLVGGDLSGIQRFLYAITSAGAAKSLRGRSAYLSLIVDAVVAFLLRELDLPPTQVIYTSGGHFYLLAPPGVENRLSTLTRQITEYLLLAHGGDLAIVMDAVPLQGTDFSVRSEGLVTKWRELNRRLGIRKSQRFRDLLDMHYDRIVGPKEGGGNALRCAVCHAEEEDLGNGIVRHVEEVDGVPKCSLCRSFDELGSRIARQSDYLVLYPRSRGPERNLAWHTVIAQLGWDMFFYGEEDSLSDRPNPLVTRLNRADLSSHGWPVTDFRWLPVFTPLQQNGTVVELGTMARNAEGAPYWACLRMDVDNLGLVFSTGLGERYSISRVATLSHLVTLFFEGYINHLAEEVDPGREHLYLIYSGGDDLLLIGSWNYVLEAAQRIRADFRRFTANNPSLTMSGGISLHREKFPLYQAAAGAGDALDAAKSFRRGDGREKDAFSFFGVVVTWEDVEWMHQWADTLKRLIQEEPGRRLSRGFLQKLVRIAALLGEEEELLRSGQFTQQDLARMVGYHRARWRLVYTLAREPKPVQKDLQAFQQALLAEGGRRLSLLRPLSRWVELATRKAHA